MAEDIFQTRAEQGAWNELCSGKICYLFKSERGKENKQRENINEGPCVVIL